MLTTSSYSISRISRKDTTIPRIRVAIVGVGNCSSAIVQGVYFYPNVYRNQNVPGLLHLDFGSYKPSDKKFVAAFEIELI